METYHDSVVLELGSLGALESVGGKGVADDEGRDLGRDEGEELVVDRVLHVDARAGAAALTVIEEESESGPAHGLLKVGVVENDVGRLAAELEGDVLEVGRRGGLHDRASDEGGSREGELRSVSARNREERDARRTFSIFMCEDMAAPVTAPKPVMTFTTPGGKTWAMREQTKKAERGVVSAVLMTMQFPVASAGPSFQANMRMGKFPNRVRGHSRVNQRTGNDLADDSNGLVSEWPGMEEILR